LHLFMRWHFCTTQASVCHPLSIAFREH
jgi:hypothetical protein